MARRYKILKDPNGNDIEFIADNCISCQKEMLFPRAEAERMEAIFPFLKKKAEEGSPCLECAKKAAEDPDFKIFSDQELQMITEAAKRHSSESEKLDEDAKKVYKV